MEIFSCFESSVELGIKSHNLSEILNMEIRFAMFRCQGDDDDMK